MFHVEHYLKQLKHSNKIKNCRIYNYQSALIRYILLYNYTMFHVEHHLKQLKHGNKN